MFSLTKSQHGPSKVNGRGNKSKVQLSSPEVVRFCNSRKKEPKRVDLLYINAQSHSLISLSDAPARGQPSVLTKAAGPLADPRHGHSTSAEAAPKAGEAAA